MFHVEHSASLSNQECSTWNIVENRDQITPNFLIWESNTKIPFCTEIRHCYFTAPRSILRTSLRSP
jgi:hypothetical protein